MKNYIFINGTKIELSDEEVTDLGYSVATAYDKDAIHALSEIVQSGKASEHYHAGSVITLCGYDLQVIGFDHDKDIDNPEKRTITLMAKTLLLQARAFHSGSCKRGWIDSDIRAWLNKGILLKIPIELRKHIVSTNKVTHNYEGEKFETADKLFLPSESELFGSAIFSDYEDGNRYKAFFNCDARARFDEGGDTAPYWTRSAYGGNSTHFALVNSRGLAGSTAASTTSFRVPVCFTFA